MLLLLLPLLLLLVEELMLVLSAPLAKVFRPFCKLELNEGLFSSFFEGVPLLLLFPEVLLLLLLILLPLLLLLFRCLRVRLTLAPKVEEEVEGGSAGMNGTVKPVFAVLITRKRGVVVAGRRTKGARRVSALCVKTGVVKKKRERDS